MVEVRGLKSVHFPSTKLKLLFCNNIELDTSSNNLPELSVYKVRPVYYHTQKTSIVYQNSSEKSLQNPVIIDLLFLCLFLYKILIL